MEPVNSNTGKRIKMSRGIFAKTWKTIILLAFLSACAVGPNAATGSSAAGQKTTEANPTPTPAVEYTDESETDLAALIVENADQLDAAVKSVIAAARNAVSAGELPKDVASDLLDLVQAVESLHSEFEQAIQVYVERFSALSPEAGSQIMQIEDEVKSALSSIAALKFGFDSGGATDGDALDQFEAAWTTIELDPRISAWQETVLTQIERRETHYMNIQPQSGQVADNRVEAFVQAHDFVQAFQDALDDGIFTPEELAQISQIGANAEASLYNTGDRQLFGYAQAIIRLTRYAVRGEWSLASSGINDLRLSLPAKPQL
jgi:hypothetical protein